MRFRSLFPALLLAPLVLFAEPPPAPAAPEASAATIPASTPPPAPAANAPRKLEASDSLRQELKALIRLLEEVHFNRDKVSPASYSELIPNTFKALDGPKLFFLESDLAEFRERHRPESLYWNLSTLGRLDAAFAIYTRYEQRVRERIDWIQKRLLGEFDFGGEDAYQFDRRELSWPANPAAADILWEQRLRFELLQELLNAKTRSVVKFQQDPKDQDGTSGQPAPDAATPSNEADTKTAEADVSPEQALAEAKTTVRKRYERLLRNLDDFEANDVAEVFLTAIAGLYDPHSTYFSPDTYEDFGINMRLQLFGIGALLGLEDDVCVLKEIIPGGPADFSRQLRPNDKILAVAQGDGEFVEIVGMKLRRIVQMIRGEKGTKVRLLVQPADAADTAVRREVLLVRDLINLDSARAHGAVFHVPDGNGQTHPYGVITLPTFYGRERENAKDQNSASADIAELIKRLKAENIEGMVLDLRRNGGGLLSEAVSLAGLFIPSGPVVQIKNYAGEVKIDEDSNPSVAYSGPLVVLTDRFSASASEIVAGALQNYGRAVVVGDSSTHGKGTVQTVIEMDRVIPARSRNGATTGATKVTVQKFYLPNGASTQLKGIVPDIVIPSIDEFLPIGEQDLPQALPWDEISPSFFDATPITPKDFVTLREQSSARMETLPEFALLKKSIDRFKVRQAEKTISLNLETRRAGKAEDKAFADETKAARKALEASEAYAFKEVFVAPPPPPRIKAEKKPGDDSDDPDAGLDGEIDDEEADARYRKMDVYLRESLRILQDVRSLQPAVAVAAK
jgi:carboxyl-terminal processing protease